MKKFIMGIMLLLVMTSTSLVSFASDGPKTTKESVFKEKANVTVVAMQEQSVSMFAQTNASEDFIYKDVGKSIHTYSYNYATSTQFNSLKFADRYRLIRNLDNIYSYNKTTPGHINKLNICTERNC